MNAYNGNDTKVPDAEDISRRSVLRHAAGGALVAAAGIASAEAVAAQASPAAQVDPCTFQRADAEIVVDEIPLDGVHDLVGRLVDVAGCTECGFLGLDLRLRGDRPQPDPWLLDAPIFQLTRDELPGVVDLVKSPQDPIPISPEQWTAERVGLDLVVEEGIALEAVHELIARLVDVAGCTECGFLGLDTHLRVRGPHPDPWTIDAPIFALTRDDVADIPGVFDLGLRGIAEIVPLER